MEKKKTPKHKLSGIPTAYEETDKIMNSKNIKRIEGSIEELELERRKRDEKAILELINDINKGQDPIVKMITIEEKTYQEALGSLLAIRNTEAFETMMLLYEYMEKQKTFKIDKLTGTELLKLSGIKSINQEKRHRKLALLLKQSCIKLTVLDPKQSLKNYRNKQNDHGLVYKIFDLLRIKKIIYSETNPETIVQLEDIEFLPEYMEHFHSISKRYVPLETIRKIPEAKGTDKTRHFVYKLCFKLASIKGNDCTLNLAECMNLGKFLNKSERDTKRKWKPIEKALMWAKELGLIDFKWNFRELTENEKHADNISTNLFAEIEINYQDYKTLNNEYYKYLESVTIHRNYNLNSEQITLPFTLEQEEPKKEKGSMRVQF
jgi:hypothetical protein